MAGKFEVYKDRAGKFRYRLKAGNGEIVASGQGYESLAGAKKGPTSCGNRQSRSECVTARSVSHQVEHSFGERVRE